ncbi:MAG: hypothetical protein GX629_13345 [Phycisphaerae bacterium]|nr:hypothetical protein [Phycisphaerae bacterium]
MRSAQRQFVLSQGSLAEGCPRMTKPRVMTFSSFCAIFFLMSVFVNTAWAIARVNINESDGFTSVSESGVTDTYTLVLNDAPSNNVTVTVTPDSQTDLGEGAGEAISFVFNGGNWSNPRTVTVTAVNDSIAEGSHRSRITHTASSTDWEYNGIAIPDVIAYITDNDVAGVTITQSLGSTAVSEAGVTSDDYTIVLDTKPTADVDITISADSQLDLGSGPGVSRTISFTPLNWNVARTLIVTAVDDAVVEGDHVSLLTHTASSVDFHYNNIVIQNVAVTISDNDVEAGEASIIITQSGHFTSINEAGPTSDTYTIVLGAEPTNDVIITITPDSQASLGLGAGVAITKTFTLANWNTPQTITLTAIDDDIDENTHLATIVHAVASADNRYDELVVSTMTAIVLDNDSAGVTITQSDGVTHIDETGPAGDTYTIVLNTQPVSNVEVTVTPDMQSNLGLGAGVAITKTFTPANWNVAQTVTVTAVDDTIAEGPHSSIITHRLVSADSNYNNLIVLNVVAHITDNDLAGMTITQTDGSTHVNETGPTSDTYTLVLNSRPTSNVTVTITPDGQTNLGSGAGVAITKTFTLANWNVAQTITVTAVDDTAAEGAHTSTITHSLGSIDVNYNGLAVPNIVAQITDNDIAGVTIAQSGSSTDVNETGPTDDTYTIVLNTPPTSNVSVRVTPDDQTDLGAGAATAVTLIFTPGDWNFAQTVTVTAVDDTIAEGMHISTITHNLSSVDSNYNGLAVPNLTVRVTDNDVAGVTLIETDDSTQVSETGPSSDTYNIVLNTPPQAAVTVTITPDSQTDLGAGAGAAITKNFTPANWNIAQTLTVTAVDDLDPEGLHVSNITHTAVSIDPAYNGVAIRNLTVQVIDNDLAGLTITETGNSTDVNETGPTNDAYEMVLNTPPSGDVVITVIPDNQIDIGAGRGTFITLTFTPVNWNVPQSVIVTAFDDNDPEGPHISTITHSAASTDPNYNGLAISNTVVHVVDNDVAGITLAETGSSTTVAEAGETIDTYTMVLNRPPTQDVIITATPDSQIDLGANPSVPVTLNFTPDDWNVPQTVTVRAVDDDIAEGNKVSMITHSVSSTDPNYNNANIRSVPVTVIDDDVVGATIVELGGDSSVNENGATSDTYTIVLNTEPSSIVTLTVTPDIQTDLGANPATPITLIFTPGNWNIPQTVTITAVDDDIAEGAHVSRIHHTTVASDPNYNGLKIPDLVVNIVDDDTLGVTVCESDNLTSISEAGTTSDTYTVVLNTCPSADVTITVTPDRQTDLGNGSGGAVDLLFTTANWNVAQTITVNAVDDLDAEGAHISTITHYASSLDSTYSGIAIRNVTVHIADNDIAGVSIIESGNSTDVSEDGPSFDTYQVVLNSPPTLATITLTVDPDNQTDVGAGAGMPITLTFNSTNWNVPQIVTVTAVDDAVAEGPHTSTITHTAVSTDPNYNGIVISSVLVNVTDDDSSGVLINEPNGSTLINEQGPTSDTYTVVLSIAPTSNVTITVDPDAQSDLGSGQGNAINLIFTPGNWNVPQTVTVTAIDDTAAEGAHTSVITHTATSADPNYNGISIRNVTAGVVDNDTAGVSISLTGNSTQISEIGPTSDTYFIVLDIPPTSDVAVTVDPDLQTDLGAGPGSPIVLTFTPANWDVPQTVIVTAVDDEIAESAQHTGTIIHTAASADPNYNRITINSVIVIIQDNDTAGVNVSESGQSTHVAEGNPAVDTCTVTLNTPPVADVMITIVPDNQIDLGAGPGQSIQQVFTSENWNQSQTVTITAVDDLFAEGAHQSTISCFSISADPNYNAIGIRPVIVNITDNDIAGVAIIESGGSTHLNESGVSSDIYTAVLTSKPTANVTLIAWPDKQSSLGQGPGESINLTFTPADWNIPQTLTLSAIDDLAAEGPHRSVIVHTVVSTDPNYNNISIRNIIAEITDNDIAGVSITESDAATLISEQGTTDTYTIVLNTLPAGDVFITITPDQQCDLGAGSGKSVRKIFTPANWNNPQTITVTAFDDPVAEGRHTATITHIVASADPLYNGQAVRNVTVTIDDNDTSGVSVIESDKITRIEEAGTLVDTYQIVLNTSITGRITIVASPDSNLDLGKGPGRPISLVFTPADWNVPQTITVKGFDNIIPQGLHSATIRHTAFSIDGSYKWNDIADVTVYIDDDDEAIFPCTFGGIFIIATLFLMSLMFATPMKITRNGPHACLKD